MIAYEPVWAIGTGKTATPEIAADAHRVIRDQVRAKFGKDAADAVRILYGGSVKPDNVKSLMAQPEIDGALVGGAAWTRCRSPPSSTSKYSARNPRTAAAVDPLPLVRVVRRLSWIFLRPLPRMRLAPAELPLPGT